ncbi:hypothetical protein [Caenimonas aquaedulcis]|uniref:Lipoprotein n=1 Tax=Caenimonas aquaedulcis TaxID=2793270 RepID=A0A931H8D4_9BURK|nr:hypothetical protein [Caenimonas aquaedulcis]MBG9390277.1 hypothetical protein [Caenimonas aquaedulcis]
MNRLLAAILWVALAGCAAAPVPRTPSACDAGESTYACQVERYHNVNVD